MHGRSNGQFQLPLAVEVHTSNMLFIGDADNNRIQVYNLAGQYIRSVGINLWNIELSSTESFISITHHTMIEYVMSLNDDKLHVDMAE